MLQVVLGNRKPGSQDFYLQLPSSRSKRVWRGPSGVLAFEVGVPPLSENSLTFSWTMVFVCHGKKDAPRGSEAVKKIGHARTKDARLLACWRICGKRWPYVWRMF